MLHTNIRSFKSNFEKFQNHSIEEFDFHFNIIGITETRTTNELGDLDINPMIPSMCRRLFQLEVLACTLINDSNIQLLKKSLRKLFRLSGFELHLPEKANVISGVVYRQHNSPEHFKEYSDETIEKLSASGKKIIFMGDTNLNLLRFHSCKYDQNFILSIQSFNLMPTIGHNNTAPRTLSTIVKKMW